MKNWFLKKAVWLHLAIAGMVAEMLSAVPAHAKYDNVLDASKGWTATLKGLGENVVYGGFLLGIGCIVYGIYSLATAGGQNAQGGKSGWGRGVVFICVGGALMGVLAMSDMISGTMTGESAEGLNRLGIN